MPKKQPEDLDALILKPSERAELWAYLVSILEKKISLDFGKKIKSVLKLSKVRQALSSLDFVRALSPREAIDFVVDGLRRCQVDKLAHLT
jgi:hypothetical protein